MHLDVHPIAEKNIIVIMFYNRPPFQKFKVALQDHEECWKLGVFWDETDNAY